MTQMAYPIPETRSHNGLNCFVGGAIISVEAYTFKNGTDVFPYGYGSGSVELPQSQLHVKQGHAAKDGHQNVGDEEGSCTETHQTEDDHVKLIQKIQEQL